MLNRFEAIGNLGADPELKYTPNSNAVCNLRVAVNTGTKDANGEWQNETLWLNVELWNEAAERAAERHRKGHRVFVEGQLRRRDYTTRDGREGTALELRFARVLSLEKLERDESGAPAADEPPIAQARPRGAGDAVADVAATAADPAAAVAAAVDDIKF
jgi:single-strand DNA-binding protein